MEKKIVVAASFIIAASLLLNTYQPTNAQVYSKHDGSVDSYMTKVSAEQYANKNNMWIYTVKICADSKSIIPASITMKSDMDKVHRTGYDIIKQGECQTVSAVMKASDKNTLGATMLERSDGLKRLNEIRCMENLDDREENRLMQEKLEIYYALGYVPGKTRC